MSQTSLDIRHLIDFRHRLHQIPELAFEEFKTAAMIRQELDRLGVEHTDGLPDAPTATIGLIGDPGRPCVALRADFDALPIVERTALPYASTHEGRMHACGHDGHTTVLLGAAAVLKSLEAKLPVCVKLLFQPAEEVIGGAIKLVNAGVLDGRLGPKVNAVFGLHGWPTMDVGQIGTRGGEMMAADDTFRAVFTGRGCHGAYPHLGADPIAAAATAVVTLQQVVSRQFDPTEPAVVTIGKFISGTASNIIPDTATLDGTARTATNDRRPDIRRWVEQRCRAAAQGGDCQLDLQWIRDCPAVINDSAMADYLAQTARAALGEERYTALDRTTMGSEDFAIYLQNAPGCFFRLGVRPKGRASYPSLHNDHFDFTDEAIEPGVRMFVELAMNFAA
jgi:amidohydrolase